MTTETDQDTTADWYATLTLSLCRIRGYPEPSAERIAQITEAVMAQTPAEALPSEDGIRAAIERLDAQVRQAATHRQPLRPFSNAPCRRAVGPAPEAAPS